MTYNIQKESTLHPAFGDPKTRLHPNLHMKMVMTMKHMTWHHLKMTMMMKHMT